MPELIRANEPFRFYTKLHLTELTGLRAATLNQLLILIKEVPGSCIYHHTHRFLQQHEYLSPEPPNDFAYWVSEVLGEDRLGERLSSIDTIQFVAIRSLRDKLIATIDDYLKNDPLSRLKFAREGEEFHFIKSVSFVFATNYIAYDLREFREALERITLDSLYFHIFDARLRLEHGFNDFSNWLKNSTGDRELAARLSRLDPYTYTLEELRKTIIEIIDERISSSHG